MPTDSNGKSSNDVYKFLTMFFSGVLVSGAVAFFSANHNAVTKDELPGLVKQNSPYTEDAAKIALELEELRAEQKEQSKTLNQQAQTMMQIQSDVANIVRKSKKAPVL